MGDWPPRSRRPVYRSPYPEGHAPGGNLAHLGLERDHGSISIDSQDPERDGVERIADLVHQDCERLAIALAGPHDRASIHFDLR